MTDSGEQMTTNETPPALTLFDMLGEPALAVDPIDDYEDGDLPLVSIEEEEILIAFYRDTYDQEAYDQAEIDAYIQAYREKQATKRADQELTRNVKIQAALSSLATERASRQDPSPTSFNS